MAGKWMSPLQRAVRVLAGQLADLEARLEKDPSVLPEYRATLREYRETQAMLAVPADDVTSSALARRFKRPADGS